VQFLDGTAIKGQSLGLKIAAGNVPNFVDLQTGGWGTAANGQALSPLTTGFAGGGMQGGTFGAAVDANDNAWLSSYGGKSIAVFDKNGKPLTPPEGITFDGKLGLMQHHRSDRLEHHRSHSGPANSQAKAAITLYAVAPSCRAQHTSCSRRISQAFSASTFAYPSHGGDKDGHPRCRSCGRPGLR
jgi:hypothetical protein